MRTAPLAGSASAARYDGTTPYKSPDVARSRCTSTNASKSARQSYEAPSAIPVSDGSDGATTPLLPLADGENGDVPKTATALVAMIPVADGDVRERATADHCHSTPSGRTQSLTVGFSR